MPFSPSKGMRVIVTGRIRSRTFEDREGQRRTVIEMDAEEVAPSLTRATAAVTRNARGATAPPAAATPASAPDPAQRPAEGAEPFGSYPF